MGRSCSRHSLGLGDSKNLFKLSETDGHSPAEWSGLKQQGVQAEGPVDGKDSTNWQLAHSQKGKRSIPWIQQQNQNLEETSSLPDKAAVLAPKAPASKPSSARFRA